MSDTKRSKFLSLVLRHKPEEIGIQLDAEGWASVPDLLARLETTRHAMTLTDLKRIVAQNDKKRFTLSADKSRIRAAQGHSIEVALGLAPVTPPETLYHGTATRFVDAIRKEGLTRQSRQHVHLSADEATATQVGRRHGKPHVFIVHAGQMHRDGHAFHQAENGVWLTGNVAAKYLADCGGAAKAPDFNEKE